MLPTSHGSMISTVQKLNALDVIDGLDETEVRTRRERGEGNEFRLPNSRSLSDILRQNVFTLINSVLFTLGTVMVAIGRVDEALTSVSLIMMNIIVGVIQELRAKRKLEQIALVTRPKTMVIREGKEREIDPAELVRGDIVLARPGDQIVVDGIIVGEGEIEIDESLLTGESDHIPKSRGDHVLSGSFVVSGQALYVARRVGAQSFANKVAAEARTFRVIKTPLQRDIDFVIRMLMLIALFLGFLLGVSAFLSDIPLMRGVQIATVIAGLVPNGLFFMVIVAYAIGAVRIVGHGALIQQANSVESLSNVRVLCMDKTGTLTANRIVFHDLMPLGDLSRDDLAAVLGDFAASASTANRTSEALAAALPGQKRRTLDEVPFSSERKWSALSFSDTGRSGTYVLGAPEMLAPYLGAQADVERRMIVWTESGLRVLLLAASDEALYLHDSKRQPVLPPLKPVGLVAFHDELRPDARATLEGFAQAGIALKVISGDNPNTVAALARQAGLPGDLKVISGPELLGLDDAQFATVADEISIFGRIQPAQKEKLVEALKQRGYYVAMVGDGVNDVLSLKKADLGIAMQSGSSATRAVADMVLLNDLFGALPPAFLEGQRIAAGMRDILRLFLARGVQLVLMIFAASMVGVGFPYIPKHISLVALLTIGIPIFFLAVWARPEPSRHGLIVSVLHFAFPAGIVTFFFGFLLYVGTFHSIVNMGRSIPVLKGDIASFQTYAGIDYEIYTHDQFVYEVAVLFSQSVLTVYSMMIGLLLVLFVEPPTMWFVAGDKYSGDTRPTIMAAILGIIFAVVMLVPGLRRFFEILPLSAMDYAITAGTAIVCMLVLRVIWRQQVFERFLHVDAVVDLSDDWMLEELKRKSKQQG